MITYYAVALTPDGRIGQLLVTRRGSSSVQEWTGKTYKSHGEAYRDLVQLNCKQQAQ